MLYLCTSFRIYLGKWGCRDCTPFVFEARRKYFTSEVAVHILNFIFNIENNEDSCRRTI